MRRDQTTTSCSKCPTRLSSEWRCLSEEEIVSVDEAKRMSVYTPGDVLYAQGDDSCGVYCLQSGLIGIRRLDEHGNSALLRLVNPGDVIGYRSFLKNCPHENTAEILMQSRVCIVNRPTVSRLLAKNPELGMQFLDHSLTDLQQAEDRYMGSVTWKTKTRFLHMLLVLNQRYGNLTKEGEHSLQLPVSRQDLADLIGIAPETMSRIIHRIESDGLAQFDGRIVRIENIDAVFQEVQMPT